MLSNESSIGARNRLVDVNIGDPVGFSIGVFVKNPFVKGIENDAPVGFGEESGLILACDFWLFQPKASKRRKGMSPARPNTSSSRRVLSERQFRLQLVH